MSFRLFYLFIISLAAFAIGYLYLTYSPEILLPDSTVTTIFNPPPLRAIPNTTNTSLDPTRILSATNQHRADAGLPPLTINEQLNQAARHKVDDMFTHQYFDHVSPDGVAPADLVRQADYDFLLTGENLALGNFSSEAELVQAWMDSPGHRANILKAGFSEIGLAAQPGTFENHSTWLAVQTFATPTSTCPLPQTKLQTSFDTINTKQVDLNQQLTGQQAELEKQITAQKNLVTEINQLIKDGNEKINAGNTLIQNDPESGQSLQAAGQALHDQAKQKQADLINRQTESTALRDSYNSNINQHNKLNQQLTTLADQLNQQIKQYNNCLNKLRDQT